MLRWDGSLSRRGGVGTEARTRLAESQRNLDYALSIARTDPVTALTYAQQAHALAADLVAALGAKNVLQDEGAIGPYRSNRSPFPEIDPGIVVTPGSADEIAKVLQLANNGRNPVIVRGNGFSMTGFVNGAPHRAIVLDTRRLDRVLQIDEQNMTVTAEAGLIMSELEPDTPLGIEHLVNLVVPYVEQYERPLVAPTTLPSVSTFQPSAGPASTMSCFSG